MEHDFNNICRICLDDECTDMHHIFNEGLNNKIIILSGIDVSFSFELLKFTNINSILDPANRHTAETNMQRMPISAREILLLPYGGEAERHETEKAYSTDQQ